MFPRDPSSAHNNDRISNTGSRVGNVPQQKVLLRCQADTFCVEFHYEVLLLLPGETCGRLGLSDLHF
ncbi:hypothetical protein PBY51_011060 [Eleginops maclovinus]|uniref:Uncharacterized protein n=1 Tax=Eleginops maclovinus TaxID=56733 RepID=A0AAN7XC44_ELEMC|nr:hypothetical protein PBY51_011060 [Eleginops maclovinus]